MKILVFGATGPTGRQVLSCALKRGHTVAALVRNPDALSGAGIEVFQGDVTLPETLVSAFSQNYDAVISVLGAPQHDATMLRAIGTKNIIHAMKKTSTRRLITLGQAEPEFFHPIARILMPIAFKFPLLDKRYVERYVQNSNLDWTLVCPPLLTDAPARQNYRILEYPPNKNYIREISKADLADFLLRVVEKNLYICEKIIISD